MIRASLVACALLSLVCLAATQADYEAASFSSRRHRGRSCFGPAETGPCRAYFRKWYYDRRARECKEFVYGGCQGNPHNRFDSKEECEAKCLRRPPSSGNVCRLEMDVGPCDAAIPRWFFNYRTGKCERFTYGGCEGNGNNFETEEACKKRCDPDSSPSPTPSPDPSPTPSPDPSPSPPANVCKLPSDSGPCEAAIPRWFFNKRSGKCEQFIYGGCRGNGNNFRTRRECQEACRDCDFVQCFADPCSVIKCPKFPQATCVANTCTGCDADFFVNGRLVDCGQEPPPSPSPRPWDCVPKGSSCRNPAARFSTEATGNAYFFPCCEGLQCCACGPPVVREDDKPPEFGTCQERCICPIG